MLFKANVSLIVCLDDLPIDVNGVLKSSTIILLLLSFPFMSVNIFFIYLVAPMLGIYIFTTVIPPCWIDIYYHIYDVYDHFKLMVS